MSCDHHDDGKPVYHCPVCEKEYKQLAALMKHLVRFSPARIFHFSKSMGQFTELKFRSIVEAFDLIGEMNGD